MALHIYKHLLQVIDDDAAMMEALKTSDTEIVNFVRYLMRFKMKRDVCNKDSQKRHVEKYQQNTGITPAWAFALKNPEYMAKRREYSREYQRKKRGHASNKDLIPEDGFGV